MYCRSDGRGCVSPVPTGLVTRWGWQCCAGHGQHHYWSTCTTRIFIRIMYVWSLRTKSPEKRYRHAAGHLDKTVFTCLPQIIVVIFYKNFKSIRSFFFFCIYLFIFQKHDTDWNVCHTVSMQHSRGIPLPHPVKTTGSDPWSCHQPPCSVWNP